MSYPEERMITCLFSSDLKRLNIGIAALFEVRRPIVTRSWRVVTPTIVLAALLVTVPKELLYLCPIS